MIFRSSLYICRNTFVLHSFLVRVTLVSRSCFTRYTNVLRSLHECVTVSLYYHIIDSDSFLYTIFHFINLHYICFPYKYKIMCILLMFLSIVKHI